MSLFDENHDHLFKGEKIKEVDAHRYGITFWFESGRIIEVETETEWGVPHLNYYERENEEQNQVK